ncbi:MAG: LysM peptidoglycan-binding domain-containing protein [Candidatus Moraniibacteriota bacterium]
MLFSSTAIAAAEYRVKAGETLWGIAQKNGVTLASLKAVNPQISNPRHILIGQKINLPERSVRVKTAKKVSKSKPVSINGMVWQRVGADKYTGSTEWAISHFEIPEFVKKAALTNIKNGVFEWKNISSGKRLEAVTFGKNKIAKNVLTDFPKCMIYTSKDYGVLDYHVAKVLKCGNWVWWKEPAKVLIPEPGKKVEAISEKEELQPIFISKEIEKTCFKEQTFDAGGGIWKADESNGDWWYLQYKYYLRNCQNEQQVFGGTLTPVVGAYAIGNDGKTDSGYRWNNAGIGPEAGFIWSGMTDEGYPHQFEFLLRGMYEHMSGKNHSVGYKKTEDHMLIGAYADYLRRFHPDYMYLLYSEATFDVSENFDSTWDGDKATDITQFNVGAKIHRDLNKNWATRLGVQVGYQPEENRLGANLNAELRYNNWLIFGPNMDYCLDSDISEEVGSTVAGVFLRVELKNRFQSTYMVQEMREVIPANKQLLNY